MINGSGDTIDADGLVYGNLVGNDDFFNDADNGGTYYGIVGSGDIVNAQGDTFEDPDQGTLTLNGSGDSANVHSSNDTLNGSAGDTFNVDNGLQNETVNGSDLTVASSGTISTNITGSNDIVDAAAANGNIFGNDETLNFTADGGSGFGLVGDGDIVNATGDFFVDAGGNTTLTLNGGGNTTLVETSGDTINDNSAGDTVDVSAGQQGEGIYGSGTTVNLAGNSGSSTGVYGTGITVTGDSGTDLVNLGGTGTNATVDGGGTVGLTASDETVTANDAGTTVAFAPDVQDEEVSGSNIIVDANGVYLGNLTGDNDVFNDGDDGGTYYGILGSGDIVTANGDTFVDKDQGTLTLQGSGDTLYAQSSSDTINAAANNTVDLSPSLQNEEINASNITVNADGLVYGNLVGNDDFFNDADKGGTVYGIIGSGDIVTAQSDGFVNIQGGSTLTVQGADDTVYDVASNETVDAASTDTVNIQANQQGETINGTDITVQGDGGVNGNIFGDDDTLDLAGDGASGVGLVGDGDIVNSTGNYLVDYEGGTTTTLNGTGNAIVVEASGDTVNANNAGNTVAVVAGQQDESIYGSGTTVNLADNSDSSAGVQGTGIIVTGDSGNDLLNLNGDGTSATVDGGVGGTVGLLASGQDATLGDQGSNVYTLGNLSGIGVNGTNYTVNLGGNVNGAYGGTGETLNLNGGDTGVIASGTSNTINNYVAGDVFNLDSNTQTTINGQGGYIGITGTDVDVTALNENIVSAPGTSFDLQGNDDDISAGSKSAVTIDGSDDILDATNSTIYDNANDTSITIEGQGNTLELGGTDQKLSFSGADEHIILPDSGYAVSPYGDVITSTDDSSVEIDNTSGQKIGLFGFTDGYESLRVQLDSSGEEDAYFNASNLETKENVFSSSGITTYNFTGVGNDYETSEETYNTDAETSEILFNSTATSNGYNYETIDYSGNPNNDNETVEYLYNSQNEATVAAFFNTSNQNFQTDFYDGVPGSNLETNEETFNSAGWETADYEFNSSEQNYQTIIYSGNPGDDYEVAQENFNAAEAQVQQIDFNSSGQSYQLIDYSGNPYDDVETYSEVYDSDYSYDDGDDSYDSDDGYDSYDDYDGGYDFAKGSVTLAGKGANLGEIASFDQSVGAIGLAAQTKSALAQAQLALASVGEQGASTTAVLTGASWQPTPAADGSRTITFSFAASAGAASDPFSSYIGAQYQAAIEKAFQAWSNATGLTFEEVTDSPTSNIRVGFGEFDTASSGILGYTDATQIGGAIQSATIRLEDPTETALSTGANGQATYAATGATLYQVALHEIGRALGFADDADPASILFPYASSLNQTLDATDLAGATLLYRASTVASTTASAASSALNGGKIASVLASVNSPNLNLTAVASATTASAVSAVSSQVALSSVSAVPDIASSAAGSKASLNQMIQAMATFAPQPASASLASTVVQNAALAQQLAAPLHHS